MRTTYRRARPRRAPDREVCRWLPGNFRDKCWEHRGKRDSINKAFCAIDGIQDPAPASAGVGFSELFAQHPVIRELFENRLTHEYFGIPIGDSDGGSIGFMFDGDTLPVMAQGNLA